MSMYTTDANRAFLPEQVGQLVVKPVMDASVAIQVAGSVTTESHKFRVPIVAADPSAAWTPEGSEISPSDGTLDELEVTFKKLAGLTIISTELAEDSNPAAAQVVGDGLARDIAKKLDAAYFGSTVTNGPDGLQSLEGVNVIEVDSAAWVNGDVFTEAVYAAEGVGAQLAGFVANPQDALALAQLKEATGSNRDLLQPDPTQATRRRLAGVQLYTSPAVEAGEVWGLPTGLAYVVLRTNTRLDVDRSAYFSSDRVGVRATFRVGFAFPHEEAVQRITLSS